MLDTEQTATVNSAVQKALSIPPRARPAMFYAGVSLLVSCLFSCPLMAAESEFRTRTLQNYEAAKSNYLANGFSEKAALAFGEACFDWADFARNDEQRAQLADEGISAMREALLNHPKSAGGHYYLGLNLGQLARTKTLGALPIVREMEKTFKASIALDPRFNHAGAHRSLGLLYFEAPGWPTSIGSNSKAREHLKKAVELAPTHPENHLCLMEAYVKWKDRKELAEAITRYRKLLPQARERYSGEQWIYAWNDWDERWRKILKSAE